MANYIQLVYGPMF